MNTHAEQITTAAAGRTEITMTELLGLGLAREDIRLGVEYLEEMGLGRGLEQGEDLVQVGGGWVGAVRLG